MLRKQSEHDPILREHLISFDLRKQNTEENARERSYVSHMIANELIELLGDYLEQRLLDRVKKAFFFSILADECRDIVKTWLRSTMPNEILSCLTLMHLNYNLEIPYEELIQKWAQQKNRLIHVDINDWLSELQIAVSLLIFNTYPPPLLQR